MTRTGMAAMALCALGTAHAMAQENRPRDAFLPAWLDMQEAARTIENDLLVIEDVTLLGRSADMAIDLMTVARYGEDGILVSIETGTLYPHLASAPGVTLGDVRISLSRPVDGLDPCETLDALEGVDIGSVTILPASSRGTEGSASGNRHATFSDVKVRPRALTENPECTFSGSVMIAAASVSRGPTGVMELEKISADMTLPLDGAAAAVTDIAVRMRAETIETRREDAIPVLQVTSAALALDIPARENSGLVDAALRANRFTGDASGDFIAMSIANAATLVEGDLAVDTAGFRVHMPGAVPAAAVANFRRAGISSIGGSLSFRATNRYGLMRTYTSLDVAGLGRADLSLETLLNPYPKEKLIAAARGVEIGFHLFPDVDLLSGELRYLDIGLDRAVVNLTGVPAGRYLEELASRLYAGEEDARALSLRYAMREVAGFLRRASYGTEMVLAIDPPDPVEAIRIVLAAIRNTASLGGILGIAVVAAEGR